MPPYSVINSISFKEIVMSVRTTKFEILVLVFTAINVLIGVIAANINKVWFEEVYVAEDGYIENLTLLPFLATIFVGCGYLKKLSSSRNIWFRITIVLSIIFSVFIIGEEISWGQRIFHIESNAYFRENNAQGETNLHNLIVEGQKVNKLIFSYLLTVVVGFYLLVLPYLHSKSAKYQRKIDSFGIPLPRPYQTWAAIALFVLIALIPTGKNAEILEFGIANIFFLIYRFPRNLYVFRAGYA